jgi:chromosome segregation ATPase
MQTDIQTLTNEIDSLHARRDKQSNRLARAVAAHAAADQERKRLLDTDLSDNDTRLAAANRLAADARLSVDTAREQLEVTQHKLDESERRIESAQDSRRRVEIVKAIDARLERWRRGDGIWIRLRTRSVIFSRTAATWAVGLLLR